MAKRTKTILLVDDEKSLRLLVSATLASERFHIVEAVDGPEALAAAEREHPDLVLLDVGLPGLDGFAVCEALKHAPATAGVPVILLTAQAQADQRQRGADVGADGYITKPFSPLQLLAAVDAALERA